MANEIAVAIFCGKGIVYYGASDRSIIRPYNYIGFDHAVFQEDEYRVDFQPGDQWLGRRELSVDGKL